MNKIILPLLLNLLFLAHTSNGQQAVFFDGPNQYLEFPGAQMPAGSVSRTVEFWMKSGGIPNEMPAFGEIMRMGSEANAGEVFVIKTEAKGANTHLHFWGNTKNINSILVVPDDEWHFVALTYDGNSLKAYLDGVPKFKQVIGLNTTTSNLSYLAGAPGQLNFKGAIRSFSIWNAARNDSQIELDMIPFHGSVAPYTLTPNEPGLIAHFALNEGSGNVFQDLSKSITGNLRQAKWTKALSPNPNVTDEGIWFIIQNKSDLDSDLGNPARRLALTVDVDNNVVMAPEIGRAHV